MSKTEGQFGIYWKSVKSLTLNGNPAFLTFSIAFVCLFILALTHGEKPFYFDSGEYWRLGETFTAGDGVSGFSLLNFADETRGYLLPLGYRSLAEIGALLGLSPSVTVKLFNAGLMALIATVLLPRYASVIWPKVEFDAGRRLLLAGLIYVFWSGYLNFPLSDLPAATLALIALIAVSGRASSLMWFVAGAASSAAVMARPAYLLLVPLIIALAVYSIWTEREPRLDERTSNRARRMTPILALVIGLVLVALPQSLAMSRHHGVTSPIPGAARDLAGFQLSAGLGLQRYETYVGDPAEFGLGGMRYIDPNTVDLVASLPDTGVDGYQEYLKIVVENPLVMMQVFATRIVNGLDQRYPTPYVEKLEQSERWWYRWINFTLVFVALLRIAWPTARRSLGTCRASLFVAPFLLCASIPASAVETRFLLPVYLLVYLVVLAPGWKTVLQTRRSLREKLLTGLVIGAVYVGFTGGVWLVASDATESLAYAPPTRSFPAEAVD